LVPASTESADTTEPPSEAGLAVVLAGETVKHGRQMLLVVPWKEIAGSQAARRGQDF
jgi:hypothetical protein